MARYRVVGEQKLQCEWWVNATSPEEAERLVVDEALPPDNVIDHIETEVWDTPTLQATN